MRSCPRLLNPGSFISCSPKLSLPMYFSADSLLLFPVPISDFLCCPHSTIPQGPAPLQASLTSLLTCFPASGLISGYNDVPFHGTRAWRGQSSLFPPMVIDSLNSPPCSLPGTHPQPCVVSAVPSMTTTAWVRKRQSGVSSLPGKKRRDWLGVLDILGKADQAGQCLHFSQILVVRTLCQVPTTTRDLTPLALHHNQHLSGLGIGRMGPINHTQLEMAIWPSHREILSSFFCQTLDRGKALAACQGSACDMDFGVHHTSAPKNIVIPNVIVSGLLLTEEVSQASLSHQHCVVKSGCIKAQPLKPPAPALSPSLHCLGVPLTPNSFQLLLEVRNPPTSLLSPLPSHCHPLPFLACPLPWIPPRQQPRSRWRLGTALPSPPL